MSELEEDILRSIKKAMSEAIGKQLTTYGSSFNKMVDNVVNSNSAKLTTLMDEQLQNAISSTSFEQEVKQAFTHKLAKTMVNKMESSIDKRINEMRSNPATKAKMILAIEHIINDTETDKASLAMKDIERRTPSRIPGQSEL